MKSRVVEFQGLPPLLSVWESLDLEILRLKKFGNPKVMVSLYEHGLKGLGFGAKQNGAGNRK